MKNLITTNLDIDNITKAIASESKYLSIAAVIYHENFTSIDLLGQVVCYWIKGISDPCLFIIGRTNDR